MLSLLFVSCVTMADYDFSNIDSSVVTNNFDVAHQELEAAESKIYSNNDIVLENLDKGLLSHYAKNHELSNTELSLAEKKIEEYYGTSISQSITSFLVNDNLKDYSGETYENIYTNIFMAINYLYLNKFDDAFVEIRRFDNKLRELTVQNQQKITSAKLAMTEGSNQVPDVNIKFHNSAFARYLSMLMYRTDGDNDNAYVDYKMIKDAFALQSDLYNFEVPTSIDGDINVPSNKARLNIVSFSGRSPIKTESVLRLPIGNTYYKLALPVMEKRSSNVSKAKVLVTSRTTGTVTEQWLEKIESIENIAVDTYQQQYAMIFAKSLARSISKAATTSVLDSQSEKYDGYAGLALSLLSLANTVVTEATERADVRTSRYFPATVAVTGLTLEPDVYDIKVIYYNSNGTPISEHNRQGFKIFAGMLNMIEATCLQ